MAGNPFAGIGKLFGRPPPAPAPRVQPVVAAPAPVRAAPPPAAAGAAVSFYRLRTGRANWLAIGDHTPGQPGFVTMSETLDPAGALLAVVPDAHRQLCFLMAPDGRPIAIRADGLRSIAISAKRLQTDTPGLARLKHPTSPLRYLKVSQPGEGGPEGWVTFDGVGNTMQDVFGFVELAAEEVTAGLRALAAELGAGASQPPSAAFLMKKLRGGAVRPELAETLIRLLPRDELQSLARTLLDSPADLAWLARAMPENPFVAKALPALVNWSRDRVEASADGIVLSPASDEFAGEPLEGVGQPQAGLALMALARRQVTPRRTACILATARNEGPYLLDWISYHLSIGFEHIFLYTNDNDDGSDKLLDLLAWHGVITLIRNTPGPRLAPQYKAYAHALQLLPQMLDYRWTAVIDVDEYFAFDTAMFRNVVDFIAWQETQPVDAIALCWLLFAAGASDVWSDESSLVRFQQREIPINQHVKSLFRTNMFWHSHAHYPHTALGLPFVFRTETGMVHHHFGVTERVAAFAEVPSAQQAWVNHYILRTAQEALWKLARGRADMMGDLAERQAAQARYVCGTFLTLCQPGATVEDTRILSCAAGQGVELAKLMALPGMAELDAQIKADFGSRLRQTTDAFLSEPPRPGEPEVLGRFRTLLILQGDTTTVFS